MPRITMNLDDIQGGTIPAGQYRCRLLGVVAKQSRSNAPMLEWTWGVLGGKSEGRDVRSFTSLQDHALFGLRDHLQAFGLSGQIDVDTSKLVGKTALLTIVETQVTGNDGGSITVNRVEGVLRDPQAGGAKGSGPVPEDEEENPFGDEAKQSGAERQQVSGSDGAPY